MTGKVHPLVLIQLFRDPRYTRFLTLDAREHCETIEAFTNIGQFSTDRKEFTLASGLRLTNSKDPFLFGR